jgi:CDP-2,3-bis-(O-geranylgeranyl)-sn-glycerol synthase
VHSTHVVDPIACAAFLIVALTAAGVAQTAWFKSALSSKLAIPLDGGRTLFGRPIFGPNKTWKGFAVMVPACGLAFGVLGAVATGALKAGPRLWALSPWQYAGLGAIAGVGFMAGELPNSFVKRRLEIPPGGAPRGAWARWVSFIADRLDSILGMLAAVTLAVPLSWQAWLLVLGVGPLIHWLFSVALYVLGVKTRPA